MTERLVELEVTMSAMWKNFGRGFVTRLRCSGRAEWIELDVRVFGTTVVKGDALAAYVNHATLVLTTTRSSTLQKEKENHTIKGKATLIQDSRPKYPDLKKMYSSIKENMRTKLFMEGSVNYHAFKCVAEGEGKPYEGTQGITIRVTEGGPLPFAFDILAQAFQYGVKVFTKYPKEIPDFFKQSFPEGFKWERVMTYEDGGVLSVSQDTSLQDGCIICNIKVIGTNFPANGPVMQKKTCGWEPSTEMVIPRDGGLLVRDTAALKLNGGGHLTCNLETTYKSKRKVNLPEAHFHHLRVERLKESDNGNTIDQHESIVACYSQVPSKLGHN